MCKVCFTFGLLLTTIRQTMKTYLPNYMRRIGLILFYISIITSLIGDADHFMAGFMHGSSSNLSGHLMTQEEAYQTWVETSGGPTWTEKAAERWDWLSLFLSITGLLIYVLSKEKVEDEFLQQLRAQSLVKAVALSWFLYFILKPIGWIEHFEGISILQLQIVAFVIIYSYTKKVKYAE